MRIKRWILLAWMDDERIGQVRRYFVWNGNVDELKTYLVLLQLPWVALVHGMTSTYGDQHHLCLRSWYWSTWIHFCRAVCERKEDKGQTLCQISGQTFVETRTTPSRIRFSTIVYIYRCHYILYMSILTPIFLYLHSLPPNTLLSIRISSSGIALLIELLSRRK